MRSVTVAGFSTVYRTHTHTHTLYHDGTTSLVYLSIQGVLANSFNTEDNKKFLPIDASILNT